MILWQKLAKRTIRNGILVVLANLLTHFSFSSNQKWILNHIFHEKSQKIRWQVTFISKKTQNCQFTSVKSTFRSVKSTFTSVNWLVIKNYVKLSIAIVRFVEKIEVFKNFFLQISPAVPVRWALQKLSALKFYLFWFFSHIFLVWEAKKQIDLCWGTWRKFDQKLTIFEEIFLTCRPCARGTPKVECHQTLFFLTIFPYFLGVGS